MESLKELYRIGPGPSSSHTVAPQNACRLFMQRYPQIFSFDAELYGSLALTGEGHATDRIIQKTFAPRQCRVSFNKKELSRFPNGFILQGYDEYNRLIAKWTVYSLGGGAFDVEEEDLHLHDEIYPHNSMDEILAFCKNRKIRLAEYTRVFEPSVEEHLNLCLTQMLRTVQSGLETEGILPGKLQIKRVAQGLYLQAMTMEEGNEKDRLLLMSYAYAACEENAAGNTCVTAPTMGASGVIAALMYYYYHNKGVSRQKLIEALGVGGIFGNIIKKNATISGAIGGCQAEVGTACAMASAIVAHLLDLSNSLIAYAAEIGIEHHLGLTCDPVGGYVIIPCIERNAVATLRAMDNAFLARHVGALKKNRVSFDAVVRTMKYTGKKLAVELRETSLGGLAREVAEEPVKEETPVKEEGKKTVPERKREAVPMEADEYDPLEDMDVSISYDGMGQIIDLSGQLEENPDLMEPEAVEEERIEEPVEETAELAEEDLMEEEPEGLPEEETVEAEEIAEVTEPEAEEEILFEEPIEAEELEETVPVEEETEAEVIPEEITEEETPAEEPQEAKAAEEPKEEAVIEEEKKEVSSEKEFRLEDFDLSLLDSFNTTYKLKEKEKEEVDAFMDKLDINL